MSISFGIGQGATLVDAFREVAQRDPLKAALWDGKREMTYGELDQESSNVAAAIAAVGGGPGQYVGILVDRTVDTPVAILGVLKSGAAYVPLDPAYPRDRLRYVVADSRMGLLVGDGTKIVSSGLGDLAIVDPADLDKAAAPHTAIDRNDAAYVIYTSGSTGTPKGCIVSHGNVMALLESALPLFSFEPSDRWAIFHSHSFDFSVWELWGALLTGASAACVPLETARSPEDFLGFLNAEGITVLNQVPSVFRTLVRARQGSPATIDSLKYLIFGGERVDLAAIREFLGHHSDTRPVVVNMYGITEVTVHATIKFLDEDDLQGPCSSPIGIELPHLRIQIRDRLGDVVPDGDVGEMWIAGEGVALGYLDREAMTRARFRDVDGRRYYRSGDLGRRLPDGELEYLGRDDEQVKIRGFRIELPEIDATLRSHEYVRDAAVAVVDRASSGQIIVAFIVPEAGTPMGECRTAIRRFVASKLPGYMVPARYQFVSELPRTSSGKLDRNGLSTLSQP